MQQRRAHPQSFIAAGLLGFALYWILTRVGQPLAFMSDGVRGVWIGVSIGLEVVGLFRLARRKTRPNGA